MDDQRLASAKALLLRGFDRERYYTAFDDLKAIREHFKEYQEAQILVKKFSRLLDAEKLSAIKTPAQR